MLRFKSLSAREAVANERERLLNVRTDLNPGRRSLRSERSERAGTSPLSSNPSRPVQRDGERSEPSSEPAEKDLNHARRAPASLAPGSNPSRPVFPARPSTVTGSARRTRPRACTQGNAIFPYFASISVFFQTFVSVSDSRTNTQMLFAEKGLTTRRLDHRAKNR